MPVAGRSELETDGSNLALVLKKLLSDEDTSRSIRNLCQYNLPYLKDIGVEQLADRFISIKVQESFAEGKELPAFLISDGTANIIALVVALFFQKQKRFAIFRRARKASTPKGALRADGTVQRGIRKEADPCDHPQFEYREVRRCGKHSVRKQKQRGIQPDSKARRQ